MPRSITGSLHFLAAQRHQGSLGKLPGLGGQEDHLETEAAQPFRLLVDDGDGGLHEDEHATAARPPVLGTPRQHVSGA